MERLLVGLCDARTWRREGIFWVAFVPGFV